MKSSNVVTAHELAVRRAGKAMTGAPAARGGKHVTVGRAAEAKRRSGPSDPGHRDTAATRLKELLRLVEIRRDRLRRLKALNAPEIVLRNERRMLRVAVNAVIENAVKVCLCAEFSPSAGVGPSDPGRDDPDDSRRQPTQPIQLFEERT